MSNTTRIHDSHTQFKKLTVQTPGYKKNQFLGSTSWNTKHAAYDSMNGHSGHNDPLFLARAAFELAAGAPDVGVSDRLLLESIAHAQNAKMHTSRQSPARSISVDMFVANLPLMVAVHLNRQHPTARVIDKARRAGVASLQENLPNVVLAIPESMNYAGAAAELGALVILQRFCLEQLDGSQWTPLPSLLSEDCDSRSGSSQNSNWDLSVYTGDEMQLTYAAQIKYGWQEPRSYHGAISVVNVKTALVLVKEKEYRIPRLTAELAAAHGQYPNTMAVRNLDARTDILMDIIEPPLAA